MICSKESLLYSQPVENALYNGIVIPNGWNHENDRYSSEPAAIPYLQSPENGGYAPKLIWIDQGRQLFVDDFLIEKTDMKRVYHKPALREKPIFHSEKQWEVANTATPVGGGVFYDMEDKLFKMWYAAGFCNRLAYATSKDGISWDRTETNFEGNNLILRDSVLIASSTVWIDYHCDRSEKYKLMIRMADRCVEPDQAGSIYTSGDGIHWNYVGRTSYMGDRSTFFYNELTGKWVFSIRNNTAGGWIGKWARYRSYHAADDFYEAARWKWSNLEPNGNDPNASMFWQKTDRLDPGDTMWGETPQIYNFDAVDYESISVGMFQIWHGPEVTRLAETKKPKITELQATFSRDGIHYDRPVRGLGESCFIPASRVEGSWDYGYVQCIPGSLIIRENELNLYYSAFCGTHQKRDGTIVHEAHSGGSMGMATLRRDGFASMDGSGILETKPLTVSKKVKGLFVNADAAGGALRAEITDLSGTPVAGFTLADSCPMKTDSCRFRMMWKDQKDLSFLTGRQFRFRFAQENVSFYSFWLSSDEEGSSDGACAAGLVDGTE